MQPGYLKPLEDGANRIAGLKLLDGKVRLNLAFNRKGRKEHEEKRWVAIIHLLIDLV